MSNPAGLEINNPKETPTTPPPEGGYPEQRHAGHAGLGPEYGKGASGSDKIAGLKEVLVGKVTRNPDKVEHGKELRTGELKKKQTEGDSANPFANAGGDTGPQQPSAASGASGGEHPVHKGEREEAATVAPEGTTEVDRQRRGQVNDKQIG
ncbi:hypothetical protein K474DRAFT_1667768 [Panus rudis PR-1116 ss-1]|nr:hypothetical protein K474DRAFT_1667768 [Panus rudis PR-1116 ss-1]